MASNTVKEYRKHRKRIQQSIRRLEKRGYVLDDNILPSIPKSITKASVRRLKKIDIESIYKKAVKLDYETGEITEGEKARKQERSEAAQRAAETRRRKAQEKQARKESFEQAKRQQSYDTFPNEEDIIISNFLTDLAHFQNAKLYPMMQAWFNQVLAQFGKTGAATMLSEAAEAGVVLTYAVMYSSDAFQMYTTDLLNYVPDLGQLGTDEFWDALEQSEDWDSDFSPN